MKGVHSVVIAVVCISETESLVFSAFYKLLLAIYIRRVGLYLEKAIIGEMYVKRKLVSVLTNALWIS